MLSISHAATGAFIAVKIGNPMLAIPLILLSHYLEDAVPHWDAGTGLGSGKKTREQAIKHGIIDLILAGILVIAMYPSVIPWTPGSGFTISYFIPIWGAFFGLLPDFLEAPRNFLKYEPWFLKPLNKFHHLFHHSIPRAIDGLAPQFLLLIILWIFR
jgi:hypothetical protein